jgi:hypothetical protein
MPVSERDRSRVQALMLLVRPSRSIAARVQTLNDTDRAQYDHYFERMSSFIARNDIDEDGEAGRAFAMTLRGYGPRLPEPINTALFGATPQILKTDNESDAARKYTDYCNEILC